MYFELVFLLKDYKMCWHLMTFKAEGIRVTFQYCLNNKIYILLF